MQTIDLRKVSLGLLVFALFLSALFTRLGIWQLDRAEQKRETLAEFEKRADASELDLNSMFAMDGGSMWGRHASVTGHYVRPIILLDNQIFKAFCNSGVIQISPLFYLYIYLYL